MTRTSQNRQFSDPECELALAAAVAADSNVYWLVIDLVPQEAFTVHRELWHDIATAIGQGTEPPPVMREVWHDGAMTQEPVAPASNPKAAAETLTDLYQRRLLDNLHFNQGQKLLRGEPVESLLVELEDEAAKVAQVGRKPLGSSLQWADTLIGEVLKRSIEIQKHKEETGSAILGLSTGFSTLDMTLNGLCEGLIILAGQPGIGKTTLALLIGLAVAAAGSPVLYVTFDNPPHNLVLKCICRQAQIPPSSVERGQADLAALVQASNRFYPTAQKLAVVEGNGQTTMDLVRSKALQAMQRHGAERCLVVIDYLQRMAHQSGYANLRESVGALTLQLREASRRLGSPILCLSSQSRQGYQQGKTNPYMETLKESGDIEYSADAIIILQEDEKQSTSPAVRNLKLTIVKNRYGEAGGHVFLTFKPALGEFRETEQHR